MSIRDNELDGERNSTLEEEITAESHHTLSSVDIVLHS